MISNLKKYTEGITKKATEREPESLWNRQNLNINSDMPLKKIYQKGTVDAACWAYMKLLREKDKTKRVYAVDPYVEVYQFRDNLYGLLEETPDGNADVWMYLIIGPEKAMLIDTGYGIGNLKGLIKEISGEKELIVVNGHAHNDHILGNGQFDRVYCHKYDVPVIKKQDAHSWDYMFDKETGEGIYAEFDRDEIINFHPYEIISCEDGYIFDLGNGYEVELIHMGGHTPGNCCFLDKTDRTLFAGGTVLAMSIGVYGPFEGMEYGDMATLAEFTSNLERLASRISEFDYAFSGHYTTDIESFSVLDILEACKEVMKDPEHNYTYKEEYEWGIKYFKHIKGLGVLKYGNNAF